LVQEQLLEEKQLRLLSFSVTPEMDGVPELKEYAEKNGIMNEVWHLLTGNRDVIYDLGRNQFFVEEDMGLEKGPDDFLHTENILLIDGDRHIRGIYNGLNKTAINQLLADAKTLQTEFSLEKIFPFTSVLGKLNHEIRMEEIRKRALLTQI
jgi:protein SCO1/2